MKSNKVIHSLFTLLTILFYFPAAAFCELQTLTDDDLSRVNAMAAAPFDAGIASNCSESDKPAGCSDAIADNIKAANDCFSPLDCAADPNRLFSFDDQNALRNPINMPSCRAGGCNY